MSESPVLLGRGQILGTFREAAELSAAFESSDEVSLLLPVDDPGGGMSEGTLDVAATAVAKLVKAIHDRVDMDIWIWGYGDGPDALGTLSEARSRLPGLDAAFQGAEEDEMVALLAVLAGAPAPAPHVLPQRARILLGEESPGVVRSPLAIRTGSEGTARRLRTFRARGGPDLPFWLADRTLGVRFSITRGRAAFRAHHPVIQEELLDRCGREGIDVE